MKCSHTTRDGRACPANAVRSSSPAACPMHSRTALQYQYAGAHASRKLKRPVLPKDYAVGAFDDAWRADMAGRVLRGELDPRLSAEARGYAALEIQARSVEAQEQLVDALTRMEHGGAAVALLAQFRGAAGQARPLPFARKPLGAAPPEGSDAA